MESSVVRCPLMAQLGPSAWFREMVASGAKADMLPGADAVIAAVKKQVSVSGTACPSWGQSQ
jgi:hypothetical protein